MTRSRVHMLTVAAARLGQAFANERLVADLRSAAKVEAQRIADGMRAFGDQEDKRIARQRTLFTMIGDTRAIDRLKSAMLQRAYDLLWDGDAAGCDALIEFLPSKDVGAMLDAWGRDQLDHDPKSQWFGEKAA